MPNKQKVEYRYYNIPNDDLVLPLMGSNWNKEYGEGREKLHFHNYYEVGICYEGEGELILEKNTYNFGQGCVSLIPPNELHTTNTFGKKAYYQWMYFDINSVLVEIYPDEDAVRDNVLEMISKRGKMLTPDQNIEKMYFLISGIFNEFKCKDYLYRDMVKHYLILLVVEIIRKYQNTDIPDRISMKADITPAIEFIKKNYGEQIKITTLASCCNMSESHFRKLFVKYMNMKPLDYLNFVRIQKSCALLRDSHLGIVEIAERVGFESASSFIRNFKKIIGCTPYQWKKDEEHAQKNFFQYNVTALKGWLE